MQSITAGLEVYLFLVTGLPSMVFPLLGILLIMFRHTLAQSADSSFGLDSAYSPWGVSY